jgi:hypothetical protein
MQSETTNRPDEAGILPTHYPGCLAVVALTLTAGVVLIFVW